MVETIEQNEERRSNEWRAKARKASITAATFIFCIFGIPSFIGIYLSIWNHSYGYLAAFTGFLLFAIFVTWATRWQMRIDKCMRAAIRCWKDNPNLN